MFGGMVVSFPSSPPCVVVYTLIIKGDDLQKINKLLHSHEIPIVLIFNSPQRESQRFSLFIVGQTTSIPIGFVDIMCSKT